MILSLQNNLAETRNGLRCSHLSVPGQAFGGQGSWHPAFGSRPSSLRASFSIPMPIVGGFTGKPGGRMPAASLSCVAAAKVAFAFALDTRANDKQEGSP